MLVSSFSGRINTTQSYYFITEDFFTLLPLNTPNVEVQCCFYHNYPQDEVALGVRS